MAAYRRARRSHARHLERRAGAGGEVGNARAQPDRCRRSAEGQPREHTDIGGRRYAKSVSNVRGLMRSQSSQGAQEGTRAPMHLRRRSELHLLSRAPRGECLSDERQLSPAPDIKLRSVSAALCRYCCKSPKLPGPKFLAVKRSDLRPPINVAPITLPRSPASLSSGNEVPHIFTRKSRLRSKEFLISSAKRLLQQNLPEPDSCSAVNLHILFDDLVGNAE
jgi:hypothetical protein